MAKTGKSASLIYGLEGWDVTDFPVLATEKNSFYVSLLLKTKQNYRTAHGCETRGATPGCHTFDLRKTFSPCLRTWLLHFTSGTIIIHPNTLFLLYNHIFKTKCWQKSRTWKQKLFRIRWLFESRILAYVCVWRSFFFPNRITLEEQVMESSHERRYKNFSSGKKTSKVYVDVALI